MRKLFIVQINGRFGRGLVFPFGNNNVDENVGLDRNRMRLETFVEEAQVLARDLVEKVKALIHEGNVRRIIIKDEHGHTFIEIPVTVAAIGAVAAPVLAAVGAISALVAKFTIVIERAGHSPTTDQR